MHMTCISAKPRCYNRQKWLCPKCCYLGELPISCNPPKIVVEEIVWAQLDGLWLPATVSIDFVLLGMNVREKRCELMSSRLLQEMNIEIFQFLCLSTEVPRVTIHLPESVWYNGSGMEGYILSSLH
jgi:hypothetical protein